jgi:hypothetical protein
VAKLEPVGPKAGGPAGLAGLDLPDQREGTLTRQNRDRATAKHGEE